MNKIQQAIAKGQRFLGDHNLKVERCRVCPIDGEVLDILDNFQQNKTIAYTASGEPFLFLEYLRTQHCSIEKMIDQGYIPLSNPKDLKTPWIHESHL